MKKQLFPKEFVGATIEHYTFKIRSTSSFIYLLLLFGCFFFILSLPFIYLDITKTTPGKVTPSGIRQTIQAPTSGHAVFSALEENKLLKKGDTLLRLSDEVLNAELNQLKNRQAELSAYIEDLKKLIENPTIAFLKTDRYRLECQQFQAQCDKLLLLELNREKAYNRQKGLFEAQAIAEKEFEQDKLNYEQAITEKDLFIRQSRTQWQQEILAYKEEFNQHATRISRLNDEKKQFLLLAPISGSLYNVKAVEIGQFLHVGQDLAQISPNDSLIATCYVSPSDIGLLRVGQGGTFRFDAFNFNEWGMLDGKIIEISNDAYVLEDGQSVFTVKCAISGDHLTLKNGFKGYIKKGMTLQANFLVANRSLYQILYDKVDDWMNPSTSQTALNDL